MKRRLCLLLAVLMLPVFSACAPALAEHAEETTETAELQTTEAKNEEKKTEANKETENEIMQEYDPAEDEEMNILMIGNSYCYYYVEELYGVAKEAGVDMNIYNLYYSGCPLNRHWEWYLDRSSNYQLYKTDSSGRRQLSKEMDLMRALAMENWDVISFQEGNGSYRRGGIDGLRKEVEPAIGKLLDLIRKQFPKTKYYWHCSWVPEVGNVSGNFKIETKEQEMAWQDAKITVAKEICAAHGISLLSTGHAWLRARYNPIIGNRLCLREAKPNDYSHDGDLGGGQYLNACVWFETLTGKSCIGNSWRPDYELSEEKINLLQKAAHEAVAEVKGMGY